MTLVAFVMSTPAQAGKDTLYGNAAGTKFCCGSGTNSCAAAACEEAITQ